ncbi:MAG: serine protease, partial [Saprospiraceae bacterium]|nr:serine protease [Saprospiraceae bacterium]
MDASIAELDRYQKALIQIATPFSTGTGFYLAKYNVIVTCEHLVRGNKKVVINNDHLGKQLSTLLYLDPQYDMAFLKGPATKLTSIELSTREVRMGELVTAIGHPYGQELATSNGVISNLNQKRNDLLVLGHSATLNPGHNGGPLLDQSGFVVGMNTFLVHNDEYRALALPAHFIIRALEEFELGGRNFTARCHLCHHLVVKGSSNG